MHVGLGDDVGDLLQQPLAVDGHDLDVDLVGGGIDAPLHRQRALRLVGDEAAERSAVGPVHGHAAAAREIAGDRFARQWLAAARELDQQVVDALHGELPCTGTRSRSRRGGRQRRLGHGRARRPLVLEQHACDLVGTEVAQRHQHVEVVIAIKVETLACGRKVGTLQPEPAQLLIEQLLALGLVAPAVEAVEPVAHLLA